MPCHICCVPASDFGISDIIYPLRGPEYMSFVRQKYFFLRSQWGHMQDADDLLKSFSLKPTSSYLSLLAGGNPFIMANVDMLHLMFAHGLLEWLLHFIEAHIDYQHRNDKPMAKKIKKNISDSLKNMPSFPGLKLFTQKNGVFELCDLNLGSSEYECLLLQLPFALNGVLNSTLVAPTLALANWYVCAITANHTDESLVQLDIYKREIQQTWAMFSKYSDSKLRFPKLHQLQHVGFSIKLWGRLKLRDANISEHAHIEKVKHAVRGRTNGRQIVRLIAKTANRNITLNYARARPTQKTLKRNKTNRLCGEAYAKYGLHIFRKESSFLAQQGFQVKRYTQLESYLWLFFNDGAEEDQNATLPNMNISVHRSAYINQPFVDRNWRVRAAPSFKGKQRFDNVTVLVEEDGSDVPTIRYCQVLLLFSCVHLHDFKSIELAFVEWYDLHQTEDRFKTPRMRLSHRFQVIPVESIISQVVLVPDAKFPSLFHLNNLIVKWQASKDTVGDAPDTDIISDDDDEE
eukprot:Lithocolla_globosa_v1_NODE_128_length_6012_cov_35.307202.p1 type:complete len:517 gc:universal NODE_128_length_6012_cov_35.307202:1719-3269(+)